MKQILKDVMKGKIILNGALAMVLVQGCNDGRISGPNSTPSVTKKIEPTTHKTYKTKPQVNPKVKKEKIIKTKLSNMQIKSIESSLKTTFITQANEEGYILGTTYGRNYKDISIYNLYTKKKICNIKQNNGTHIFRSNSYIENPNIAKSNVFLLYSEVANGAYQYATLNPAYCLLINVGMNFNNRHTCEKKECRVKTTNGTFRIDENSNVLKLTNSNNI